LEAGENRTEKKARKRNKSNRPQTGGKKQEFRQEQTYQGVRGDLSKGGEARQEKEKRGWWGLGQRGERVVGKKRLPSFTKVKKGLLIDLGLERGSIKRKSIPRTGPRKKSQ